ncbi:MAG: hypothetical protein ABSH44_17875 [Bryobacteraceae bacterium]|jgi:hypothetical protein
MNRLLLSGISLSVLAAAAQTNKGPARPVNTIHVDVAQEKAGSEPAHFVPVVGYWVVASDGSRNILMVDGRQWKRGDPSGGLADKARLIYGSRHEEFIDNVKAFAYYPYAVAQGIDDFRSGEIGMRFQLIEGALDQCAGILFNLKPNGDYLAVRFNGKEDNLVLWTFNKGVRKFVKRGAEEVPLKMKEWHTMKVAIQGARLEGYLNGKLLLEYALPEPVSGKVGVWSKTDSVSYFDDYSVTPAP